MAIKFRNKERDSMFFRLSTSRFMKMSNSVQSHYELNERFTRVGDKNVWVEFTALARDYNAVNLGQVILYSLFLLSPI